MASEPTGEVRLKFEPGIYFDLPNEDYHNADALGSTDFIALWADPASWWWNSRYNPLRPERGSDDGRRFGSAAHVCLLEGIPAYEQQFGLRPEKTDHTDALHTIDDLKDWLRDRKLKLGGNRPALVARILEEDPDAPIWDEIVTRALKGRDYVKEAEDARLRLMRRVIDAIPHLRDGLATGLSELSVFWWDEELQMTNRVRFDRITAQRIWDLKTFNRQDGVPPRTAALRAASRRQYHIQADHYLKGAAQLRTLVSEGRVFGGSEAEIELLKVIACNAQDFSWLFYPNNGAPTPQSIPLKPGVTLNEGAARLSVARNAFQAWQEIYGLDRMWVSAAAEEPLDDDTEGFSFWRAA